MRILSQDGINFNDIPYDRFCFGILKDERNRGFNIIASNHPIKRNGFSVDFVIAKYSTAEKAQKAMDMLHIAYCGNLYNVIDEFVFRAKNYDSKPALLKLLNEAVEFTKYYQFPADNEIEV